MCAFLLVLNCAIFSVKNVKCVIEGIKGYPGSDFKGFINGVNSDAEYTGCIFKISRGQFHELFTSHASKFSIINNSVTVDPSSNLSLICDHDVI